MGRTSVHSSGSGARARFAVLALFACGTLTPAALAAPTPAQGTVAERAKVTAAERLASEAALQRLSRIYGRAPRVSWQKGLSTPHFVAGELSHASAAPAREIARRFVSSNKDLFAAPASTLRAHRVLEMGDVTAVHFTQWLSGLPVFGGGLSVSVDHRGVVRSSGGRLLRSAPASLAPKLSAPTARLIAERKVEVFQPGRPGEGVTLGLYPSHGGGTILAYRVVLPAIPELLSAPTLYLDANDGRLLRRTSRIKYLARGKIYEHNPIISPNVSTVDFPTPRALDGGVRPDGGVTVADGGVTIGDGGVTDSDGGVIDLDGGVAAVDGGAPPAPVTRYVLENANVIALNCIDNHNLRSVDFGFGPRDIHICDQIHTAISNDDGDFMNEPILSGEGRFEDAFSEQMMYVHVNRAYEFYKTLGLRTLISSSTRRPAPINAVANFRLPFNMNGGGGFSGAGDPNGALFPFDNAFFFASGEGGGDVFGSDNDALIFGEGTSGDFAYDADVVYHEFGHAVIQSTSQITSVMLDDFGLDSTPGGLNEGYPDYFSSALAGDPNVGEFAGQIFQGGEAGTPIRAIDNQDTCPKNIVGETHADSTMWTGALWEARMRVPAAQRATFDRAVYVAMAGLPQESNFETAALNTLEQVFTIMGQAASSDAEQVFIRRGMIGCEHRIETYSAPHGELYVEGRGSIDFSPFVPGYMQTKITIPSNRSELTVSYRAQPLANGTLDLRVLFSQDTPVQFVYGETSIDNPGDFTIVKSRVSGQTSTATAQVKPGDVYVMVVNYGQPGALLTNLRLTLAGNGVADGGSADAGPPVDAGTTVADAGTGGNVGQASGCSAAGGGDATLFGALFAAFLALGAWPRRRRAS